MFNSEQQRLLQNTRYIQAVAAEILQQMNDPHAPSQNMFAEITRLLGGIRQFCSDVEGELTINNFRRHNAAYGQQTMFGYVPQNHTHPSADSFQSLFNRMDKLENQIKHLMGGSAMEVSDCKGYMTMTKHSIVGVVVPRHFYSFPEFLGLLQEFYSEGGVLLCRDDEIKYTAQNGVFIIHFKFTGDAYCKVNADRILSELTKHINDAKIISVGYEGEMKTLVDSPKMLARTISYLTNGSLSDDSLTPLNPTISASEEDRHTYILIPDKKVLNDFIEDSLMFILPKTEFSESFISETIELLS